MVFTPTHPVQNLQPPEYNVTLYSLTTTYRSAISVFYYSVKIHQ
jgi:hypothetical protein